MAVISVLVIAPEGDLVGKLNTVLASGLPASGSAGIPTSFRK